MAGNCMQVTVFKLGLEGNKCSIFFSVLQNSLRYFCKSSWKSPIISSFSNWALGLEKPDSPSTP